MKVYQLIATNVQRYRNSIQKNDFRNMAEAALILDYLVFHLMPSGCGIDEGTVLDLSESYSGLLQFDCSYHHMDDVGNYTHWTEHTVKVKSCFLNGFTVEVDGLDHNNINDFLEDRFTDYLDDEPFDSEYRKYCLTASEKVKSLETDDDCVNAIIKTKNVYKLNWTLYTLLNNSKVEC